MNILKSLDTFALEKMEALIEKAERVYLGRVGTGDLAYRLQDLMEGIDDVLEADHVGNKRIIRDLEDEVEELENELNQLERRVEDLELELDELKTGIEE